MGDSMNPTRYPLYWPAGWKRTKPSERKAAAFSKSNWAFHEGRKVRGAIQRLSLSDGIARISTELRRLDVEKGSALVSSNIPIRLDGGLRGDRGEPSDPGVAVYWEANSVSQCIAIDLYQRVADNLAAVSATLAAMRAIQRHGGAEILHRAFRGFTALPERAGSKSWHQILKFHPTDKEVTPEMIQNAFREMAKIRHPDAGGSEDEFRELLWARDQALLEIAGRS
jgi:hypothetical protein